MTSIVAFQWHIIWISLVNLNFDNHVENAGILFLLLKKHVAQWTGRCQKTILR